MADITKCERGCKNRAKCYRWTAPSGYVQSFSDFQPDENGKCKDFYPNYTDTLSGVGDFID